MNTCPVLLLPVLLSCGLFAGGCAARLPVGAPSSPAPADAALTSFLTVSTERVTRSAVPAAECATIAEACREGGEAEEELLRHGLGVFLGYTFERGEGGFTVGLDYGYRFNQWMSVGPFIDYVAGEHEAFAMGAGVWLHPFRRVVPLMIFLAPGVDLIHVQEETEEGVERIWETKFLTRVGFMYGIEVGQGCMISPSIYWDWIGFEKSAYVVGLTLGREF